MQIGYKFPKNYWNDNKEQIIDMYLNKNLISREIAEEHGCWPTTIIHYLKKWGVPVRNHRNRERYNSIYNVNIHYFDKIDNPEKAYWLGYIASDGHVSSKALQLGCHYKDVDLLEQFKECIGAEHPILTNNDGNTIFTITSKHLVKTLNGYGLMHDKTFSMHLKEVIGYIPQEYTKWFFTGLFDGDGSIRFYNYDNVKGFQYHFGFTGLKESVDLFADYFHIRTKLVDEGNGIFTVRTSNAPHILWCLHRLYDDCSIYCHRKYETALEVYKLIDFENKNDVKGVSFVQSENKWTAQINKNNKLIKIGRFNTRREAELARLQYEYDHYGAEAPQWYFFDKYGIGG